MFMISEVSVDCFEPKESLHTLWNIKNQSPIYSWLMECLWMQKKMYRSKFILRGIMSVWGPSDLNSMDEHTDFYWFYLFIV